MQWLQEIFNDGVPGDAARVLELCATARQSVQAGDRDLALNLLLGAALRCWWADTGPAARARVAEVNRELTDATGDPRYVAALAVAEPVLECAAVMDLLSRFVPGEIAMGSCACLAWPPMPSATPCAAWTSSPAGGAAPERAGSGSVARAEHAGHRPAGARRLGPGVGGRGRRRTAGPGNRPADLADRHASLRRDGQRLPRPYRAGLRLRRRGRDGEQPAAPQRPAVLRPARPGRGTVQRGPYDAAYPQLRQLFEPSSPASTSGSDSAA